MRDLYTLLGLLYTILVSLLLYSVFEVTDTHSLLLYLLLLVLLSLGPLCICVFRVGVLEPYTFFSLYFMLIPISIVVYLIDGSIGDRFWHSTDSMPNVSDIIYLSLYLCFSFIFFTGGYVAGRKMFLDARWGETFHFKDFMLDRYRSYFLLSSYVFMLLALMNLAWVIYVSVGFDVYLFFTRIGYYSSYVSDNGATTLGYLLAFPAYFLGYYYYSNAQLSKVKYLSLLLCFLVIVLSMGRVTFFVSTLIVIILLYKISFNYGVKRLLLILSSAFLVGVLFFYFRYSGEMARVYGDEFNQSFIDTKFFVSILYGSGNLPNFPIVYEILSRWENSFDYFYGSTFIVGILSILPLDVLSSFVSEHTVSLIVYKSWYSEQFGGAVPPTIFGEAYANFGFVLGAVVVGILGFLFSFIYSIHRKHQDNFILTVVYLYFLITFCFLLPKGEIARFSTMLFPLTICIYYLFFRGLIKLGVLRN